MPTQAETPPASREELLRVIEARDAEVGLLKLMVQKLKLQLARRNRNDFGSSSERFDAVQGTLLEPQPLYEVQSRQAAAKPAANAAHIDRSLPAHLPREDRVHQPETTSAHHDASGQPCGCTACGARLRLIGKEVSEQLEYVPARFKVIRHVRPKLACVKCHTIFQASAPSRPIAKGVAAAGLLAHVMVAKYCDHLPLYRQSGIYAREGVAIDRSTMAGWVDQCEQLLDPLVAALGRYVMAAQKVHADDTPVKVLQPGAGKTKQGRLWVYVRDDRPAGNFAAPAAWFQYSANRKGEHPRCHLKGFRGTLQADAYGGWNRIYDSGAVVEAPSPMTWACRSTAPPSRIGCTSSRWRTRAGATPCWSLVARVSWRCLPACRRLCGSWAGCRRNTERTACQRPSTTWPKSRSSRRTWCASG